MWATALSSATAAPRTIRRRRWSRTNKPGGGGTLHHQDLWGCRGNGALPTKQLCMRIIHSAPNAVRDKARTGTAVSSGRVPESNTTTAKPQPGGALQYLGVGGGRRHPHHPPVGLTCEQEHCRQCHWGRRGLRAVKGAAGADLHHHTLQPLHRTSRHQRPVGRQGFYTAIPGGPRPSPRCPNRRSRSRS